MVAGRRPGRWSTARPSWGIGEEIPAVAASPPAATTHLQRAWISRVTRGYKLLSGFFWALLGALTRAIERALARALERAPGQGGTTYLPAHARPAPLRREVRAEWILGGSPPGPARLWVATSQADGPRPPPGPPPHTANEPNDRALRALHPNGWPGLPTRRDRSGSDTLISHTGPAGDPPPQRGTRRRVSRGDGPRVSGPGRARAPASEEARALIPR